MAPMADERCDLLCLDLGEAERLPSRWPTAGSSACATWPRSAERSENHVSHHLRVLRGAGLVRSRRDGKMVMYEVTAAGRGLIDAMRRPEVAPL